MEEANCYTWLTTINFHKTDTDVLYAVLFVVAAVAGSAVAALVLRFWAAFLGCFCVLPSSATQPSRQVPKPNLGSLLSEACSRTLRDAPDAIESKARIFVSLGGI